MIRYAVELFVDDRTEQYVRGLWKGLEQKGITDDMASIQEIQPHLTVAVYNELDTERFQDEMAAFMQGTLALTVPVDIVGCFPASGTVFLGPTVTAGLLQLHQRFHNRFNELRSQAIPFYLPGRWNPHCTLATNLTSSQLGKTLDYCVGQFSPFQAVLQQIGLVELTFEQQKCTRSRTLFAMPLVPPDRGYPN
ncbi:2'-5' RNA ligase family protein [Paenibacillus sp. J2TS4]|uniref:2'-5' RNA ligase family protein n=1 Tax=Paenibacillus sp. J2TS4 TaxID=2807194 RepID=UPI001B0ECAFD|nr:2'-5' RNA ligase family protein [Paenibacillus sp. J2TS4]GIP33938.1 hypothetical protein J2TS4_31480 [Paenibacillus sp. J2TS4]